MLNIKTTTQKLLIFVPLMFNYYPKNHESRNSKRD